MKVTRRDFSRLAGTGVLAAAAPGLFAPALAQDKPLRIGIIAPRSGAAGTAGECGIRAVQWAAERMNRDGGIAGRQIELVFEGGVGGDGGVGGAGGRGGREGGGEVGGVGGGVRIGRAERE